MIKINTINRLCNTPRHALCSTAMIQIASMRCPVSLLLLMVLVPGAATYAADFSTPLGLWKTIDDKTGKPRALVRIYSEGGKFYGRIEQSFTPGAETRVCDRCTDGRKNQPIIGLIIIRNVRLSEGEYGGGDILDPDSGTVYRCKFHLEQDGSRLVVRGFIGFSLLGRSQTWQRSQ